MNAYHSSDDYDTVEAAIICKLKITINI